MPSTSSSSKSPKRAASKDKTPAKVVKSESPTKKKSTLKATASSSSTVVDNSHTVSSSLDVILPAGLGRKQPECNVLVQIDPTEAIELGQGIKAAIGRFHVDKKQGLVLDLQGSQYQGRILPGPTAMIASLHYDETHTQHLKLDVITDEFCPLVVKTKDTLAQLDAQVVKGTLDESYYQQEEDVNKKQKQQQQQEPEEEKEKGKKKGTKRTSTASSKKKAGSNKKPRNSKK
ncbi:expressed unknown protein [Seminavis robusta]|uniref:Uncharacterized protein n=1 Tax=Seminavis robusta TaxID=568900 RepID=A0A9N8D9G0_9STRA|nr:expressed unknown protein [Seminavis robusta]|eukprot:Sro4_g003600.1 n/a (231) ;mRNA; f:198958-199650